MEDKKIQNGLVQQALSQLALFGADRVTGDLILKLCQEIENLEDALREILAARRKPSKKLRKDAKNEKLANS